MSCIAIVPARSGSKRLPDKNIRELGGKPLIGWTISAALDSKLFDAVIVSTDSDLYAEIARNCGASVPSLRPADLATDAAASVDVVRHEISQYASTHGAVDSVALLQPTSPFRSAEDVRLACGIFEEHEGKYPVVSVTEVDKPPEWLFSLEKSEFQPILGWDALLSGDRKFETTYRLNGSIYWTSPELIDQSNSFITPGVRPLIMRGRDSALDIDTPEDWKIAEALVAKQSVA